MNAVVRLTMDTCTGDGKCYTCRGRTDRRTPLVYGGECLRRELDKKLGEVRTQVAVLAEVHEGAHGN